MPGGSSSRKVGSRSMTDAELAHKLQVAAYRRQSRLAMRKAGQLVPENTIAGNALTAAVAFLTFLACLTPRSVWPARLPAMATAPVLVGIAVLILVFVATVLSVIFATRGAMASNKDVVAVLHFVGAEDGFVAREFQRHFLLLGLRGGLLGAVLA